MPRAVDLLKERYYSAIKEDPELFIGIELEYPVVNLAGEATDTEVTKSLMSYLAEVASLTVEKKDLEGTPVQLVSLDTGDMILFEVSYNTIELAFGKVKELSQVEERLKSYLALIQPYLRQRGHELQGEGVNPNWAKNDNSPVKLPRYEMLMNFLSLSKNRKSSFFHDYPEYGAFICGSQVQLDVSRDNYLRVLNAFNQIEGPKALLFANSEFWGSDWDLALSRDIFWEYSMHGVFKENVGVFPRLFKDEEDYFTYLSETAIFTAERPEGTYYFEPIRAKDYLKQTSIEAWDLNGNTVRIEPSANDFQTHRSYQFQDLTKRGTVEFRSVCTQAFEATFSPAAFHLGLLVNLEWFEQILSNTDFFERFAKDYPSIRRLYSKKIISKQDLAHILPLLSSLLVCAEQGLVARGYGEEAYLHPLKQKLTELQKRLD